VSGGCQGVYPGHLVTLSFIQIPVKIIQGVEQKSLWIVFQLMRKMMIKRHTKRGILMPLIQLSLIKGRTGEEKRNVARSVHAALVEAFHILENDINIRITEYDRDDFLLADDKSSLYTLVEISAFAGRSLEAKRNLYAAIVRNLNKLGVEPRDIMILIHEEALDNWGVRGGKPASEVNLGFKVDV
ncbi:MAG: tautomerase family protein, partial [Clostridia bacterium]|nr:tautomerase family protein [Clostridia bacterium]